MGVLLFSVKSSWEVHWIVMFQKDAVWYVEFEKIGSFFQWFMKCPKAQRFSRSLFLLYIYFFFLFFCNYIVVALPLLKTSTHWESIFQLRYNICGLKLFMSAYLHTAMECWIFKVEKILEVSLDLIPSPSPSVKSQIMGGKAWSVKANHCWTLWTNFSKQKVCWPHPAMFCLITSSKPTRQ